MRELGRPRCGMQELLLVDTEIKEATEDTEGHYRHEPRM